MLLVYFDLVYDLIPQAHCLYFFYMFHTARAWDIVFPSTFLALYFIFEKDYASTKKAVYTKVKTFSKGYGDLSLLILLLVALFVAIFAFGMNYSISDKLAYDNYVKNSESINQEFKELLDKGEFSAFKAKLESYGIIHSMSRVSKCIDNGPCENVQGIIKDMMAVLYPNIQNEEELIKAIDKTIKYYNEENPMKRFKGKTPSEVRKEAKSSKTPIIYPIPKNPGIEKFWAKIEKAKEKERQVILQNI